MKNLEIMDIVKIKHASLGIVDVRVMQSLVSYDCIYSNENIIAKYKGETEDGSILHFEEKDIIGNFNKGGNYMPSFTQLSKTDKFVKQNLINILYGNTNTIGQKVRPVYKDGTPAHTLFINQVVEKYNIANGEFPITTLRPIHIKKAIGEILWIYRDQSNDLDLLSEKYGITWWDEWEVNNTRTIGQRYGATVKRYKLMDKLLDGLINEPYTRRHIMNMYQETDFEETEGLNPCAFMTIWTVRGKYLDMTLTQRSSDYLVAGHINKMQYVALMMMVARHVGLEPGTFMHVVDNLHIYDRHKEQAIEMLNRTPSEKQPTLILKEGKTDFYDFEIEDFELVDYEPVKPQLKFELGI